jgi:hypothetical protein
MIQIRVEKLITCSSSVWFGDNYCYYYTIMMEGAEVFANGIKL